MANSQWKPQDDEMKFDAWVTDKKSPGALFYFHHDEDHLIEILNTLGRSNPRNPSSNGVDGGQGEYFEAIPTKIEGLAILPKQYLKQDQITQNPINDDSQVKIKTEATTRLKKGLPAIKCPPIVVRDNSSREFRIQSGHNRNEYYQNTYPGEGMLVVIASKPKVHSSASLAVAAVKAKLAANPSSPTRAPTLDDRVLAIQEAFRADPYIHDIKTGIPYNRNGTPLADLDKGGEEWKRLFEYVCGKGISKNTIGKVYARVTGNSVSRRVRVTNETIFHDLNSLGWETGVLRQENGQVQSDFARVSWDRHIDHGNKSLIIAKELAGNHFDTAMYAYLVKPDLKLQEKGIESIYLHANLGKSYKSAESLRKAQNELIRQCQKYNELFANDEKWLPIKKVCFPQQDTKVPRRLFEFTDSGVREIS